MSLFEKSAAGEIAGDCESCGAIALLSGVGQAVPIKPQTYPAIAGNELGSDLHRGYGELAIHAKIPATI